MSQAEQDLMVLVQAAYLAPLPKAAHMQIEEAIARLRALIVPPTKPPDE